ncbi:MAG: carboxypeptidase-like regulatory domain-containing protein [Acidobacteriota bacterium]
MTIFKRILLIELFFIVSVALAYSQVSQRETKPVATGSISGQVTIDGKPQANVMVVLQPANSSSSQAFIRTQTDSEGRYRFLNVAAGSYALGNITPGFISSDSVNVNQGKRLILDEGEAIEGMDISLKRGATITGRIVDANQQPIIETVVSLLRINERSRATQYYWTYNNNNPFAHHTDDRGIYRIYGLPSGRYKVSVGRAVNDGSLRFEQGGNYQKTFYPSVTDESRAQIVEVKAGEEVAGIDITVGAVLKTYSATGRIIDVATGKPLANIAYGVGGMTDRQTLSGAAYGGIRSNAQGEFQLDGLSPGHYAVMVWNDGTLEGFAEPVLIEIADRNVSGLELRVHRGASISGVVVVEGTNDPAILGLLQSIWLRVSVTPPALDSFGSKIPTINADGSFRISGLRAGKAQIIATSIQRDSKLFLSRIEQNGIPQKEFDLKAGEQITGVRLIFVYGNGVIRGQLQFENGAMPEGARYVVYVKPLNPLVKTNFISAEVSGSGKFIFEALPPGEYELELQNVSPNQPRPSQSIKKNVTVTNDAETSVIFTPDAKVNEDREE